MNDEIEYSDIEGTLSIRTPSNKMEGVFKLYAIDNDEIENSFVVATRVNDELEMGFSVIVQRETELNTTLDIKYRDNDEMEATLEVVGSKSLDVSFEIRPNNMMFGKFELIPAPRVNELLSSIEDSTTRSREDLMTLNYGSSQRMMIGRIMDAELGNDYLESFVKFGNIASVLDNFAILETANLRLYYTGDFYDTANIEVCLPSQNWQEYGITHANKPYPSRLVTDKFTVNREKRYIEFDVKDIFMNWYNEDIDNFGFLIRSNNSYSTSFYTKESNYPPVLNVQYISNLVYSAGRSELESTMFIIGAGNSDLNLTFEVHSDYGVEELESTLYVHRAEVPVESELISTLTVIRPDQHAEFSVARRDEDTIDTMFTIVGSRDEEKLVTFAVNRPELDGWFTVDPNISLPVTFEIKGNEDEDFSAFFAVSRESVDIELTVRAIGDEDLDSIIEVPSYDHLNSTFAVSHPELDVTFNVHRMSEQDAILEVKEREYLDTTFLVYQHDSMEISMSIKHANDIEATFIVSKPELEGYFYPRVIGEDDQEFTFQIRQLDASDLDVFLIIKGKRQGAYYYIL